MFKFKRKFLKIVTQIKSSYWFLPSILLVLSILLSFLMIEIDNNVTKKYFGVLGWIFSNQAEGARSVLSTIAGSIMSVAGVTFSMTFIAISHASSQIGPRVLSGFMNDRGNQFTLGVFVATFTYCLFILRTVKGGEDKGLFIPHLSIIVAIILAVISIIALIYFVHHVPKSISMTQVIDEIGDELKKSTKNRYPCHVGEHSFEKNYENVNDYLRKYRDPQIIKASGKGYIEYINTDFLMRFSKENDLILDLEETPGDFLNENSILAKVYSKEELNHEKIEKIRNSFIWGVARTYDQDIMFSTKLLVEIAAKALSPGVNDPFTACECINQLEVACLNFIKAESPSSYRYDENSKLRIIAKSLDFDDFIEEISHMLRQYVTKDFISTRRMMDMFLNISQLDLDKRYNKVLCLQGRLYFEEFKRNITDEFFINKIKDMNEKIKGPKN